MAESEDDIQLLCLVSAAVITCIIGLMIHFFIVGVSVIDWLKRRPLTTADLLITSIGTSRIIFQFASLFVLFWITFSGKYSTAYVIAINIFGNCSVYCNIWLSALLSVFYSLKISNFHNILFLYLKKIISQRVVGLIIIVILLSIAFSSLEILEKFVNIPNNSTHEVNLHIAEITKLRLFIYRFWNVLPFFLNVMSSLALLGSLSRHMLRMKHDKNGTSHLDAYYKTIKFTIVSFFCFALYLSLNAFGMYYLQFLGFAGFHLFWNCFPMVHSIYLIYVTARLRSHFFKILHGMTKCLLLRRSSESTTGVQIQIISQ